MTPQLWAATLGALVVGLLAGYLAGTIQAGRDHRRTAQLMEMQRETWKTFAQGTQFLLQAIEGQAARRVIEKAPPVETRIPPPGEP